MRQSTSLRLVTSLTLGLGLAACGGGGNTGPDAAYPDECGPVKPDGTMPNTLQNRISFDTTLKKMCSPYHIDLPTTVTATLTIEPGVKIVACQGGCRSRLTIGATGKLVAQGLPEDPIIFTSRYADSGGTLGGQWTGILFLESQPGSFLTNVIIEFAGGPYSAMMSDDEFTRYEFPVEGSLLNDSTPDITVADVWIRRSRGYAVATTTSEDFELSGDSIYTAFDRITLTDNAQSLWIPVDQGGTLGADICWAERDTMGVCPGGAPAGHVIELHHDDELDRVPESVTRDATWKAYPVPYVVDNINIRNNALLTIADGVEIRMKPAGGIVVGLNDPGALSIVASTPGGITIRSSVDNPTVTNDYWRGLYIWDTADSGRTRIENVDLGFGGRQAPTSQVAPGLISIFNASPTIIGNHVHDSPRAGIHWDCVAQPPGLDPMAPPASTNTSNDPSIVCADPTMIGAGIAQNWGCTCPGSCPMNPCPNF